MSVSEIRSSTIFNKYNVKCNFAPIPLSKISCEFSANCIDSNANIIIVAYIYCNIGGKHKLVQSEQKYVSISSSEQRYKVSLDIPDFSGSYNSFVLGRLNPAEDTEKIVNVKNMRISRVKSITDGVLYDERNIISVYPFVVKYSGYGILVDNVVGNLPKLGYTVTDMDTNNNYIRSKNISLFITLPPSFFKTSSKINIGYTMFEATKIPSVWIDYCNMMDRLFVPCNANIEAFRSSGVTVPIDVIPIGVDTKLYDPELYEPSHDFGLDIKNTYKFLVMNDGQPRKNNDLVIRAFSEEFNKEIIAGKIYLIIRQHNPCTGRNIIHIKEYLEDQALASLIRSCDSMISASSGEAGDIPILIGMSMAKPVVVTKEFVHPDYVEDEKTGYFIETESIVPAYTNPDYLDTLGVIDGAKWINPSLTSLKEKMRYVYENRDEAAKVGRAAREYIIKNRDNTVCISKMVEIFKTLTGDEDDE